MTESPAQKAWAMASEELREIEEIAMAAAKETDTDFLSRMFSQSAVPQGQAADPDMTRLLALAAEAARLREALEEERRKKKLWRGWYDNEVGVTDCLRQQLAEARALLSQKESTP